MHPYFFMQRNGKIDQRNGKWGKKRLVWKETEKVKLPPNRFFPLPFLAFFRKYCSKETVACSSVSLIGRKARNCVIYAKRKTQRFVSIVAFSYGGQRGIRTLDTLLTYTRVPVVRLRPAQPSVRLIKLSLLSKGQKEMVRATGLEPTRRFQH